MLLVDHHKRQMLERDVLRKHRMGTKEHVELARLEPSMNLFTLGRRRGARQERPGHASLRE